MALLNPKRLTADYPRSWANIIYYTFHITGLLVLLPNSCTTIQEPTFRRQKTAETPLTLYQPPKPKAHLYRGLTPLLVSPSRPSADYYSCEQ
jgi:hypothetical protein